jgi:hypothetical protein
MPDFLASSLEHAVPGPLVVLARLLLAMLLGGMVALIYRGARAAQDVMPSFTVTLVLLAILIAMVTQVIGDNVARAFSLVGALSIVRFRTVVRDTQDTAYVIFAVAVGMAVGANHPLVAVSGIVVVAGTAFGMKSRHRDPSAAGDPDWQAAYVLNVRVGLGHDPNTLLGAAVDPYLVRRRLDSITTARQGMAIDVSYKVELRSESAAADLVQALNRLDGVHSVALQHVELQEE